MSRGLRWIGEEAEALFERSLQRLATPAPRPVAASPQAAYQRRGEMLQARESDVLAAVLRALRLHPAVAWVERMNVGAYAVDERYIKFGFKGMADITGQLKDGRRLEVEVKTQTGELTAAQAVFLATVRAHKGVAFVARGVDDVLANLGGFSR